MKSRRCVCHGIKSEEAGKVEDDPNYFNYIVINVRSDRCIYSEYTHTLLALEKKK